MQFSSKCKAYNIEGKRDLHLSTSYDGVNHFPVTLASENFAEGLVEPINTVNAKSLNACINSTLLPKQLLGNSGVKRKASVRVALNRGDIHDKPYTPAREFLPPRLVNSTNIITKTARHDSIVATDATT